MGVPVMDGFTAPRYRERPPLFETEMGQRHHLNPDS